MSMMLILRLEDLLCRLGLYVNHILLILQLLKLFFLRVDSLDRLSSQRTSQIFCDHLLPDSLAVIDRVGRSSNLRRLELIDFRILLLGYLKHLAVFVMHHAS